MSSSRSVAVLVFAHKPELEWYEIISLQQCGKVLAEHPIFLVCPDGMDTSKYLKIVSDLRIERFDPKWLATLRDYNRFKVSPPLYERFRSYDFLLTYELDAFVFRDDLHAWCAADWDYIGAPWFEGHHQAGPNAAPAGVGNSGFSLRKTKSCLAIFKSRSYTSRRTEFVVHWLRHKKFDRPTLRNAARALLKPSPPMCTYQGPEDFFWTKNVVEHFPWYRVAPYEDARNFSFEVNPRRLFQECNEKLPFGCHKWMAYDPEFWKPFFAQHGVDLPI